METWNHDTKNPWKHGSIIQRTHEKIEPYDHETMIQRTRGTMKR